MPVRLGPYFFCLFVNSAVTHSWGREISKHNRKPQAPENMAFLSAEEAACGDVKGFWFHFRCYVVITDHNHWVSEPYSGEGSLR